MDDLFETQSKLLIVTGNITASTLQGGIQMVMASPSDELVSVLKQRAPELPSLAKQQLAQQDPLQQATVTLRPVPTIMTMSDAQSYDRADVRLTTKIFLQFWTAENVRQAVDSTLEVLDCAHVDTVILALPPSCAEMDDDDDDEPITTNQNSANPSTTNHDASAVNNDLSTANQHQDGQNGHPITSVDQCAAHIRSVWTELEQLKRDRKVHTLGIADVSLKQLSLLHDWATVKPDILHFNIAACCTVPPELTAYAKQKNIRILTHNDPSAFLPDGMVHDLFGPLVQCDWLSRETIFIKARSILLHKSYLVHLSSSSSPRNE